MISNKSYMNASNYTSFSSNNGIVSAIQLTYKVNVFSRVISISQSQLPCLEPNSVPVLAYWHVLIFISFVTRNLISQMAIFIFSCLPKQNIMKHTVSSDKQARRSISSGLAVRLFTYSSPEKKKTVNAFKLKNLILSRHERT